jgi:hypothetical protein
VTGPWAVVATEEFEEWMMSLTDKQRDALEDRIQMLRVRGPALTRPTVGHITNSRHKNMKELRCTSGGHLRALFMFMPNQEGVMLFGGSKSGEQGDPKWNDWYRHAIPIADDLADREMSKRRKL